MDTATEVLAVGYGRILVEAGEALEARERAVLDFSTTAIVPRAHSRWLQPAISLALQVTGAKPGDVEMVGVGVGPGSYTGVRLAVSTAKALATTLHVPLVPIPTPLSLAEAARGTHRGKVLTMALQNARRHRAFGGLFLFDGSRWRTLSGIEVRETSDWARVWRDITSQPEMENMPLRIVHNLEEQDWHRMAANGLAVANSSEASLAGDDDEALSVYTLQEISSQLPAAMLGLMTNSEVKRVVGDDIHAVVPEYALLVEAESRLAEGSGRDGGTD